MRCLVTGGNVTVIGRAIHALARIGDECYLEALEEGLALRSVNSSRSAYACFLFSPLFFQKYVPGSGRALGNTEESQTQIEEQPFRCKIVMKSILSVFKSPSSLEKTVEKCKIALAGSNDQLVIQLLCKHGITKTHNLSFQECETLQAVYTKGTCPNALRAQPKLLMDTVIHFPSTLEELTLDVNTRKVTFRNYVEPDTDPKKMMLTEMVLTPQEFDEFCVKEDSEITFCLKELRGLLGFAETSGLPLTIHFDGPGRPVIFSLDEAVLEVNFVLATLADGNTRSQRSTEGSQATRETSCLAAQPGPSRAEDDFMSEEIDSYMIAMETSAMEGMLTLQNGSPGGEGCPPSPTFPLVPNNKRPLEPQGGGGASGENEEEEEEGEVPATPPHKKQFRSLFFGSLLSPRGDRTRFIERQEVLAEASDSEGEM